MRNKIVLPIMMLIMVMIMASCENKPDASLLPEPQIEFTAVKGLNGATFKINVLNVSDALYGVTYRTDTHFKVTDTSDNVLFEKTVEGSDGASSVTGVLDGVNAGDTLICTVIFDYYGHTTSATASDVVI